MDKDLGKQGKNKVASFLKREDYFPFLEAYYESIGRTTPPNYKEYSLQELKKCFQLFKIQLVREK